MERPPEPAAWEKMPHNLEAEEGVLCALLTDSTSWELLESEGLRREYFYYERTCIIFTTIYERIKQGDDFDVVIISDDLRSQDLLEKVGGEQYLRDITFASIGSNYAKLKSYVEILRETAIRRGLIRSSSEIQKSAQLPQAQSAEQLLDQAERKILAIGQSLSTGRRNEFISARRVMADLTVYLQELATRKSPITGLETGFSVLDHMTTGLHPGELIVIAGRPSMGKTAFALNIAQNVALNYALENKAERPAVAIFSMEMPARHLGMRILSAIGRIDNNKLRIGDLDDATQNKLLAAMAQLKDTRLFINESVGLSVRELRSQIRRLRQTEGRLDLVVIDYLQLMQIPDNQENRATQLGEVSRALKVLAMELNIPIIALSQLNRSLENRSDRTPQMSDIRESGAIEQDADVIMFVYRPVVYSRDEKDRNQAKIILAKQRNGPIGTLDLHFEPEYTLFQCLQKQEDPFHE